MILGADEPRSVSATGGLYALKGRITTPDVLTAHFDFDGCPLTWRHRIWGATEYAPEVSNGIFFYGDQQMVFVTDNRWVVIEGKNAERQEDRQADAERCTWPSFSTPCGRKRRVARLRGGKIHRRRQACHDRIRDRAAGRQHAAAQSVGDNKAAARLALPAP